MNTWVDLDDFRPRVTPPLHTTLEQRILKYRTELDGIEAQLLAKNSEREKCLAIIDTLKDLKATITANE